MRKIVVLALIAFAVLVMARAGPAYAAQTTGGTVLAVDTVVGTQNPIPVQLVRGMHGGSVGHMSVSRGSVGSRGSIGSFHGARFNNSFHAARFNHSRFHNARFRHFRNFRPFVLGSVVPYSYYYSNYNNCYWDGYAWMCDDYTY
jgi:hypothetical protein